MNQDEYLNKLKGAIISRFAGCALGAPVEMMPLSELKNFCEKTNNEFPPKHYFLKAPNPDAPRYKVGKGSDFTRHKMQFLSTDDDIMYTLLSLLVMEDFGFDFSTEQIAEYWIKYLPLECTFTAERTTLNHLHKGIHIEKAKYSDLDERDYIGAAIRIDGYGYVYPGNPEKAVQLAYRDANLSHSGDGIYSALYFSALISLAFVSNDITKSMHDALEYVPKESRFYREVRWALSQKEVVKNYQIANQLVSQRYPGMSFAHAINNACLTIWGIYIGRNSIEKGITETVAMCFDNDCTSATVGSVLGAYHGIEQLDPKWYKPWNNRILSYLNGLPEFSLDDIINRFYTLGAKHIELK